MRESTLPREHGRARCRGRFRSLATGGAFVALLGAGTGSAGADEWHDGEHWVGDRHGYGPVQFGRPYCPPRRPHVVVENYYYPPAPVTYVAPPTVVYGPPQVVYAPPQPVYAPPPAAYLAPSYGNGDRLLRSAVLGAAGGYLGSRIGNGSGRAAATAAGAVAGWVLGNQVQW